MTKVTEGLGVPSETEVGLSATSPQPSASGLSASIPHAPAHIADFRGKYAFLSNYYPSPITIGVADVIQCATVEHAYQAMKSMRVDVRKFIASQPTPGLAKYHGRRVEGWRGAHKRRINIMRELLLKKFHEPNLAWCLLSTGSAQLIEGNTWGDHFWGVCNGYGENWLGRLLMEVREGVAAEHGICASDRSGTPQASEASAEYSGERGPAKQDAPPQQAE